MLWVQSEGPTVATAYDPNVIRQFADRLYRQAATITVIYTLIGLLAGAVIYAALGSALRGRADVGYVLLVLIMAGTGIVGFIIGRNRAFLLKLQAQTALCQVAIEENVRRGP